MFFRSLHAKLLFFLIVVMGASLAVGAILFSRIVQRDLHEDYRVLGTQIAQDLTYDVQEAILANHLESITYQILGALNSKNVLYVLVYDGEGQMLRKVGEEVLENNQLPEEAQLGKDLDRSIRGRNQQMLLDIIHPIRNLKTGELIGYLRIGMSLKTIHEEIKAVYWKIFWTVLIVLLVTSIILFVLLKYFFSPIRRLTSGAKRVGRGDWNFQIPVKGEDELSHLSKSFNQMVDNLKRITVSKDKAEEANRLKGEFLTNISHELRTPLNGILGMSNLALDTELSEEQKDYLNTMQNSAEDMLHLVDDLLDFSQLDAGELILENEAFDLKAMLTQLIQSKQILAETKGLRWSDEIETTIPTVLMGDAKRIEQILNNLIDNAIKFTEKGQVSFHVFLAEAIKDGEPISIHFKVQDTGVGIPQEKQHLVFEAFSQVDGSMTRKQGGTGVGLGVCFKLVEIMQGKIWFESKIDTGTCFHLVLPLELAKS